MASLVELVGVKGETEADGGASVELGAVGESSNATVVDLDLSWIVSSVQMSTRYCSLYLGERERVKLVLRRKLKTAGLLGVDVVASLGADLNGGVDALVVAGGNDAEVLGANDAGSVVWGLVSKTQAVLGDGSLLDVVASLTTNEEALVSGSHVNDRIDVALSSSVVDEGARVDVGVLEGQVELLDGRALLGWVEQVLEVDLDAGCGDISELDLGVEQRSGGPRLGDGHAFVMSKCQRDCTI